ncbi:sensor histidine kinase [Catelliglobosispora koreensis]|uniref:sensor histidine kinase n=1 Tax=Catelliglobosispora koreensis TaxID=129052 RepID=UPI000365AE34|nr:HAMP domain-containing sensor histidine kinase [Catelliglobosispora koreensis]
MSDTVSTRTKWIVRATWLSGALLCALAMYLLPSHETIPYHVLWIGLVLAYGFTVWQPREMLVMVAISAVVTGTIMSYHASLGRIDWIETAEIPLSVILTAVVAHYLRKRHLALAELARIAQEEHRRIEARQHLVRQVSHELRTPITIARGYTELVRERVSDPVVAEDTAIVLDELDKLAQITERLVTLMQIEGQLTREPLALDRELARIVRRWTPAAERAWEVTASSGTVLANRERLEVAVDCLLDNAVKHTARGDRIKVTGSIDHDGWSVEVTDTGAGMNPGEVPEGIGLSTVRGIAQQWGGTIEVRSRPGAGTTVSMTQLSSMLPVKAWQP